MGDRFRLRWAVALLAASGCDEAPPEVFTDAPETQAADPMWSGCWLIDESERCQVSGRSLAFWFPEAESDWRWTLGGEALETTREDSDGGVRFSFEAPPFDDGPVALVLWDRAETPVFTLELLPNPIARTNFAFGDEVAEAAASSSLSERTALAERLLASPPESDIEGVARVHHARQLRYDPSAPGDSAESSLSLLEREEELAADQGLWGVRCEVALVGLYWGTYLERRELVRRWGKLEGRCRGRSAALAARFDRYLGVQALVDGAYAEAETRLSRVPPIAARVLPKRSLEASMDLMDLYARTGRWSEAQRELESLQALPFDSCERWNAQSQIGFVRVRERQAGDADLGDPRAVLEAALDAHSTGPCKSAGMRTYDLVKLGYDAALRGDRSALRDYVSLLSAERLYGKLRHQAAELELELAVAENRFTDVRPLAAAMDALLEDSEPEAQWRLHMLLGKAAVAQGDNAAAQAAHLSAEAVLDGLWSGMTSGALRSRWMAAYRRSAIGLMHLRLEANDPEGAACAVRSARRRALDVPAALGGTTDPCQRPWARAEGEAVFLIVPETDDEWYVFVIVDERVVSATRVAAPRSPQDDGWWDRWTDLLGPARRVRILASGAALRSPLHLQGWKGKALVQQHPVTFGLDLDPEQTQRAAGSPTATVVFADVDPYRALSRYAADIKDAHARLERGGWSPRWFETSQGAVPVSDLIPPGGLFLYYGHGERVSVGSAAALSDTHDVGSSALLVAQDGRWGSQEVSALEQPPRWAALLGCDVAFPDTRSWSGGLNLAHALLLAGTHEVLAAVGPVDAAMAARVSARLVSADASEAFQLSEALQSVWAASPSDEAAAGLGALRVWSR